MRKEKMWKTLAIVFIILFSLLLIYNLWAISYWNNFEEKTDECYYEICEEYVDALYEDNVCSGFAQPAQKLRCCTINFY